jgi:serine protease Do
VYDGSPAYQAGIQPGDLILSFNGHPIERTQDLPIFVSQSAVGSPADLEVQRGGQRKDIKVKLSSLDQASQQVAESSIGSGVQTKMGVAVRDVSPQEGQQQGIPPGKGVTVTDIARGSTAETVGIQPGDVILQINEQAISNSNDFLKMTQGLQRGQPVRIFVKRGPMTSFFAFKI